MRVTLRSDQERIFCIWCDKYRTLTKRRICRVCGSRVVSVTWRPADR